MEGVDWMLGAGAILAGVGSMILAAVSLRNPIELGASFHPASEGAEEVANVSHLNRAATREAWRRSGTFLLAAGLFLQATHIVLRSGLGGTDWLAAGISVAILSGFAVRQWQAVRQAVLDGAGGWSIGGWGA